MSNSTPPFILIDGSSYFYRAFHALPPLSNSRGQPTGAVYGVINMIRKLLKDYNPTHVAVIFDAKGKTFRDHMYPEYKAHRPPMPDDLVSQKPYLLDAITAMGLPLLMVDGVEADDVIGTLATQASQQGMHTLISTGDKDMAQLVDPHVTLINTMSNTVMDQDGVEKKFSVPPERIIDYLSLIGDKVDNVPGVDKVGPKTAVKWLSEYGSLDNIMEHAEKIKGKVGENLRSSLSTLPLSRKLVTIKRDVDLNVSPESLTPSDPDTEKLAILFKELEFKRWLDDLSCDEESQTTVRTETEYETILTKEDLARWVKQLNAAEFFAFDTETTALNYMNARLVGVSFAIESGKAAYIPFGHDYEGAPQQLAYHDVMAELKPILEDSKQLKIGQNLKYDLNVLANHNIQLQGIAYDTMLESYVLNSGANRHDMDSLALKFLGKSTIHFEDVAGKGSKQVTFNQVDIQKAAEYAAEDADITLQLHQTLWPELQKEEGLKNTFAAIEMPLMPVLANIERNGVLIDPEKLHIQSQQIATKMQTLEEEAYIIAGEEFNLASPKQLQAILFEKLELPVLQKTPKGQASTAESVLQDLALDYPLPKIILEYRSISKLKSTYTDKLPEQINERTGRVHTSYNQAVTATGRLSSSDPNLQNIPVRTEEGRRIRQAFIAPEGYQIVSADYSQIELRIMAHLSNDEGLHKAFENGWDVHSATAAEVFHTELEKVTKDQRRSAKAINFGLIYGMSAFGLAKQLGTSRQEAQDYIDIYFARYPGVQQYMDNTRKLAHEHGYVETLFGRRLYLPEINARNMMRQKAAERTAINAPLQGTAADIIKMAMINMHTWLQNSKLDARMIMQVHDELVFEVAAKDVKTLSENLDKIMCQAVELAVPIHVELGIGNNWDEAH